jgi:hypothetical protein
MDDIFSDRGGEIFEFLRDTNNGISSLFTTFDLLCSLEDVRILMFARNYKQCPNCGWWVEAFDLIPEDETMPDGCCGNCRIIINE